jgi:hypothetical protein
VHLNSFIKNTFLIDGYGGCGGISSMVAAAVLKGSSYSSILRHA